MMASIYFNLMSCLLLVTSIDMSIVPNNHENKIQMMNNSPPDHKKVIAMARYIIHNADWASVATFSTIPSVQNYPFANVISMSDGPVYNSTGTPYFYLTPLDFTSKDLKKNPNCTVLASLEETQYCQSENLDPEDPRCARIMMVGEMAKVDINTAEHAFALAALFSRHPSFPFLPKDHGFYVAKLKATYITMLDWFGGPKTVSVADYFAFNYTTIDKYRPTKKPRYEVNMLP